MNTDKRTADKQMKGRISFLQSMSCLSLLHSVQSLSLSFFLIRVNPCESVVPKPFSAPLCLCGHWGVPI